jgi:tRNA nucleotidyltransferase/poly(A) polymerase
LSAAWRNVNSHGNHPNQNSSREDWLPGTEWYDDNGPLLPTPVIFSRWVEDANIREEGTRDALGLSNAVFGDESTPLIKKSGFDKKKTDLSLRNRKDVENNLARFSDSEIENYLVALEWNVPDEGEKGSAFSLLMPNDPLNMDRKEYTEHLDVVRKAVQNRNQFRQAGTDGDARYRRERIERFLEPWNEFGGGKMGDVWKRDLELSGDTVDERGNIVRGRFPERQRSTTLTSIERFRGEYEYPNFRERFYPRTEDVERAERRKAARKRLEREREENLNRNREYNARYGSPSERPDFFPEPGGPPEGGPPASRSGPRRAAGPPPAGGPPRSEDPDDVDVFNAVHGGMDAPEGMGENRVADAIQRHLNAMSDDERNELLNSTPSDSRIFDHPDRDLIREDQLAGMALDDVAKKYGVSPEYVKRMNQAIRERGVNKPEMVPSSDPVNAPVAPAQSGFRRLVDEVRAKLSRKARINRDGKMIVRKFAENPIDGIDRRDLIGKSGFARKFINEGFELHIVGGAVRDAVLGRKNPKDIDLATNATPEQIARVMGFEMQEDGSFKRVERTVRGTLKMTGDDFPVLRYTSGKGHEYEIATYRADLPEGGASIEGVSLRDDVSRRDLTINGLAYDLATEEIVDHVGGLADLGASIDENGNLVRDVNHVPVVRAIGDPAERLAEDPVRAIRAIRFASSTGGTLDPDTLQAIKNINIEDIPNERIRTEVIKGLATSPNTEALFKQLDESGLLNKMFPDLDLNPDTMNVKNLGSTNTSVHLAALLRGNDPEKIRSSLSNLKYTNKEIDGVLALHELSEVTPETAPSVMKKLRNLVRPEGDGTPTLTRRDLMNYGEVHNIDPVTVGAMINLIDEEPITFDSLGLDIPEGPDRSLAVNTAVSARFEELLEANSGNNYIKRSQDLSDLVERATDEGGTFRLTNGTDVRSGWAISRNNQGIRVNRADMVDENGEPTEEGRKLVYGFIAQHLDTFGGEEDRDGVTVALGAWADDDYIYLDVTDVYAKDKFNFDEAKRIGKEQNQKEIADLDKINDGISEDKEKFIKTDGDGSDLLPMAEVAKFFPEYDEFRAAVDREIREDRPDAPDVDTPKVYPSGVELTETPDSDLVNLAREVANGDYGDENVDQRLENLARIARRRGQVADEANLNLFNEIDEIRKNRGVDAPAADAPDADVTPDVDATPDVRTLDADALEGAALKSEIDSIVQEIMDGEGEIGVDLEKLREAAEKAEEGYGREIQQRLLDKFAPSDDFLNDRGRVDQAARRRFLNELFEDAEGKITVNVTPLTEPDDSIDNA